MFSQTLGCYASNKTSTSLIGVHLLIQNLCLSQAALKTV